MRRHPRNRRHQRLPTPGGGPTPSSGLEIVSRRWQRRILKERDDLLLPASKKPVIPAAFIEFASQADAQTACQTHSYCQPLYVSGHHVGVRPFEIPFLSWVLDLPGPILPGLVSALALAWLMSICTMDHSHCRTRAGTPTLALVEVYCLRGYIIFPDRAGLLGHDLDSRS